MMIPNLSAMDSYQEQAHTTALYDEGVNQLINSSNLDSDQQIQDFLRFAYCGLKLTGEAGEAAELIGKALRDAGGVFDIERRAALEKELGDVLWYISEICTLMGWSLSELAEKNLRKLAKRQEEGKLHGQGSER